MSLAGTGSRHRSLSMAQNISFLAAVHNVIK
jgi:hypothetical protein